MSYIFVVVVVVVVVIGTMSVSTLKPNEWYFQINELSSEL